MARKKNEEPEVSNVAEGWSEETEWKEEEIAQMAESNETPVSVKLLLVFGDASKLADDPEEGWTVDGVAVDDGTHALVVSLNEVDAPFGCVESQDEETGVESPSMSDFDGEARTAFLIEFYGAEDGALIEAKKYGWLPSGGELAFIYANKSAINEKLEVAGGDLLSDADYWTSQKFSNERIWSMNMESGVFGVDRGCVSELKVRSVKSLNIE